MRLPKHIAESLWERSQITAYENRGRNNQRRDLRILLANSGYSLTDITAEEADQSPVSEAKDSRKQVAEERIQAIVNASDNMDSARAAELREGAIAPAEDHNRAIRADLRDRAPGVDPTDHQVKSYLGKRLGAEIRRYAIVQALTGKDKRRVLLAKGANWDGMQPGQSVGTWEQAVLLADLIKNQTDPAKVKSVAARVKHAGLSLGSDDTSVNQILSAAYRAIGVRRIGKRVRSGSTLSYSYTLHPHDVAWQEAASTVW